MRRLASLRALPLSSLVALAALPLAAACSDDEHTTPDAAAINCETDTRADNLVAGLEKTGDRGTVKFRLMSATPSPPKRPTTSDSRTDSMSPLRAHQAVTS